MSKLFGPRNALGSYRIDTEQYKNGGSAKVKTHSCLVATVAHQLEGRYQQYKNRDNAKVKVTGTHVYTEIAVTRFMQSMPILTPQSTKSLLGSNPFRPAHIL